ncbi:MAG: 4-(cytidine 5'-diphospho)-2-C-methyl-D-erythritol kinase, partial [Bacillota bacterium]|nr:4-(cytidine 5'-diphospho)-2-C-methyl-D-erythritol kinase [Bacillota bacterium]
QLMELAAQLGSDMPFCVLGGTALATGKGEILEPLNNKVNLPLILIKPNFGASTKMVYQSLRVNHIKSHPATAKMIAALAEGNRQQVIELLGNVLEEVTLELYPELAEIKSQLRKLGIASLMSGSGTTIFGVLPDLYCQQAVAAKELFAEKNQYQVFLTTTI